MTHSTPPAAVADELRRLTALELSLPSRLRYVALLLAASAMSAVVIALLLTEPALPLRTSMALAVLAIIGVSWTIFAVWVLTRKRVLLGSHRIVAGRMAIVFTSVFAAGALAIGLTTSKSSAFAAAAMGGVMLVVAVALWARAKRRLAQLSARRDELQRLLGQEDR
jgi:hypothetical protein